VDKHMSDRTYQAAVLQDGAAAHSLHDTARCREKFRVGNLNHHVSIWIPRIEIDPLNANIIKFCLPPCNGREDLSITDGHLLTVGHRILCTLYASGQSAVDTGLIIGQYRAKNCFPGKFSPQFPG